MNRNNDRGVVLILTGPGGSGKSTVADLLVGRYGFVKIDGDDLDMEYFPNGGQWLPGNTDLLKQAHRKILSEVTRAYGDGKNDVVLDYIVFGDYLEFFSMFREVFGDNLEIRVLFPMEEENVRRDAIRTCWTTGRDRITAVRSEFEAIRDAIGAEIFIDTTGETPTETVEKLMGNGSYWKNHDSR